MIKNIKHTIKLEIMVAKSFRSIYNSIYNFTTIFVNLFLYCKLINYNNTVYCKLIEFLLFTDETTFTRDKIVNFHNTH